MKVKYIDLIEQTFDFPQNEFKVREAELYFNDIPLMDILKQYGTPLKISYLPKISENIQKAKTWFNVAIAKSCYKGKYFYSYCTKSSHFSFVLNEALKNDIHIETSSAFDIPIIEQLYKQKRLSKDTFIICNGYKQPMYAENISSLINSGFKNTIPIIDNVEELDLFENKVKNKCNIGIRIASEEGPMFEFYTSRLGIRTNQIKPFYKNKISSHPKFNLRMLHFFINTGIKDTAYYWNELRKSINTYCELKKICPELKYLNIGGGFPVKTSLDFKYDYEYMTNEIVSLIKEICYQNDVEEPDIFTEFGTYTVGESGAVLYSVLNQKRQNDKELWNMIDSSFMTTLPDTWALNQKFILLAINNFDKEYERVNLGGQTCDSMDYYNTEAHTRAIFLPKISTNRKQYVGMFHTGAYQESLGGYGGIQHCLIPAPKHVIIDKTKEGKLTTKLFAKEQTYKSMLKTLGY